MASLHFKNINKNKLRIIFAAFFLLLATPTLVLINQGYKQLKWEAFHQSRLLAEELASRIDKTFLEFINQEETRSFSDYAFLNVTGNPNANFLQRSPLSSYPPENGIPGFIGYFQIDTSGLFTTPLLPSNNTDTITYGVLGSERTQRLALQKQILNILTENQLVQTNKQNLKQKKEASTSYAERTRVEPPPQESLPEAIAENSSLMDSLSSAPEMEEEALSMDENSVPAQAAFEKLNQRTDQFEQRQKSDSDVQGLSNFGRLEDLKLDSSYGGKVYESKSKEKPAALVKRSARKTREALPEAQAAAPAALKAETDDQTPAKDLVKVRIFESEIDPFEFSLLDSGHFVIYRKVWRDGQRYIQGMLFEQTAFLEALIAEEFHSTALANMSDLIVAYQGQCLLRISRHATTQLYFQRRRHAWNAALSDSNLRPIHST